MSTSKLADRPCTDWTQDTTALKFNPLWTTAAVLALVSPVGLTAVAAYGTYKAVKAVVTD